MFNHTPTDYKNPFALLIAREKLDTILSDERDIFYEDAQVTAFIASSSEPANQGNVLIVPNIVYENIYDIPDDILSHIHVLAKRVAIAMKHVYCCEGVTIRQHNEPAGYQEVWHYHLHVVPRYTNDDLYPNYPKKQFSEPQVRFEYALKLKDYFSNNN